MTLPWQAWVAAFIALLAIGATQRAIGPGQEVSPMAAKKQTTIPGTERKVHKDVRTKAEALYEVRSQRMELSRQEKTLADALLAAMKRHEITEYTEEEMTVTIVVKEERVRVKKAKVGDGDEE